MGVRGYRRRDHHLVSRLGIRCREVVVMMTPVSPYAVVSFVLAAILLLMVAGFVAASHLP